mgnify:CR=1 FL=1
MDELVEQLGEDWAKRIKDLCFAMKLSQEKFAVVLGTGVVAGEGGRPVTLWQQRDETGQLILFSSEDKHCRCDSCIKYI